MHIWGTFVHMYTKHEVSMSNPVAGEVCTDDNYADANDEGQCMTVQGSLVDKPNEPKIQIQCIALW